MPESLPPPVLQIKDLRVRFQTEVGSVDAVDGISLQIGRGRILGLVGESGCGKSVTSLSILRLIRPPGKIIGGNIHLCGKEGEDAVEVLGLSENAKALYDVRGGVASMIFQEPMTALSPVHTVGNQVCEAILTHQKVSKAEAEKRAVEMLAKVGIPNPASRLKQYPFEFSGGMRQRVMIAMALVCNPGLLIADEPTTALDVTIQAQILQLICKVRDDLGAGVLLITHDLGVVAQAADDVAVMYLGRIVEQGSVHDVLKKPIHPYTKGLLASLPGLNTDQHRLSSIKGSVPAAGALPPGCPFHPRCPYHKPGMCDVGTPPLLDARTEEHAAACVRWREIEAEERSEKSVKKPATPLVRKVVEAAARTRDWVSTAPPIRDHKHNRAIGENNGSLAERSPTPLLSVRHLCKFFPIRSQGVIRRKIGEVRAVHNISFDVAAGETLGIVGESGSGKTTAARAILRAIEPTSGDVLFHHQGQQVNLATLSSGALKPLRQQMQMIFQDPFSSLNPRMTVGDIVGEPLVIHQLASGNVHRDKVVEALTRVGLKPEHRTRYPHAFSGGQRQRIGIARALIMNPSLIVADEAVSALDVSVQAQVINLLEDLQEELQLTYIFIAHDLSVVKHICDRAAVMYCGKVVELGSIDEIYANPYHPYTQALLAAVPSPDPDIRLRPAVAGETADPAKPPVGCSFHPRCPFAQKGLCDVPGNPPPLQETESGQWAACFRAEELARCRAEDCKQ